MKKYLSLSAVIPLILLFSQMSYSQNVNKPVNASDKNPASNFIIKVGYFEFPGLTYTDPDGKPAGFVNEITIKTLEHAGIRYTITSYPAARFFDYLSKGKIDLFNGLSSIPVVHDSTIASKLSLFPLNMRVYSVGRKKIINRKEDLVNHSVILVRGFSYNDWGKWIRDAANGVKFYEADTHEAAFEMLRLGRATYLLNYKYIDEECLKKIKISNLVIHTPRIENNWHCSFNIYKNTPQAMLILKKLDDSYLQLIREGKLNKYN